MSSAPARPPAPRTAPAPADRRARWAVSLIFFLNGCSFCALLPRYPDLVDAIGLNLGQFGLAVGLGPVGGLLAGLGAAALMRRFGSGPTAVAFQVVASTVHLFVYLSGSWLWLATALLLAAASDAITDISMNAHGMRVERRYRRSILNSYHGWWSLGAVTGGFIGAACAGADVPLWLQGTCGLVLFGALAVLASRFLLPGPDGTERAPAEAGASAGSAHDAPVEPSGRARRLGAWQMSLRSLGLLMALGMVLVFAGSTEDAGNTWGALFMRDTFAVGPFLAGMAFVALQGAQTIGRFTGDAVVDRLGDRTTARLGALLSAAGMTLALLVPHPATAIIGFACAGWGIATLFPAAFRAADELPGVTPGVGITMVGWLARVGFFVSPPIIGALGDAFTLRYALWLMPLYAVGILAFSRVLDTRRPRASDAEPASTPA